MMVGQNDSTEAIVAVIPLSGEYGHQLSELITEQLTFNGIRAIEMEQVNILLREYESQGYRKFDPSSLAKYGRLLGVKKILTGSVTTTDEDINFFPQATIKLKAIDVLTEEVSWIGEYSNRLWSPTLSTQRDIRRGAKHIVEEFIEAHGGLPLKL
ncbi:MAG: hypothetical protein DRQ61_09295 [Gammaproteobacteria bacterium]|nr:MAG: hypothetical protein DRQ61_09295 [Gammaproteobacteria bacterium]